MISAGGFGGSVLTVGDGEGEGGRLAVRAVAGALGPDTFPAASNAITE
jgi:hypothetical protein